MDFRPMNDVERRQLISALRNNAERNKPIMMNRRDTSFDATAVEEVTDDEVIAAIKSVPCHYSQP